MASSHRLKSEGIDSSSSNNSNCSNNNAMCDEEGHSQGSMKPTIERGASWCYSETRILLSLWGQDMVQRQLTNSKRTRHVWEKIAERIKEHGYDRTADQVRTRVFNMITEYRRILKNPTPERKKKCIFFDALHKIYQAKDANGVKAALNYDDDYNLEPLDLGPDDGMDGNDDGNGSGEDGDDLFYAMSPNQISNGVSDGQGTSSNGKEPSASTSTHNMDKSKNNIDHGNFYFCESSQKKKNSSLALPSPSSSQGQTRKKSPKLPPKPKKVKHSSEDDEVLERLFWDHLDSFDDFVKAMRVMMLTIGDDPKLFALKLFYILVRRIIDLEKKLNQWPAPSGLDKFNESIWITKDGQRKLFTYRIRKMNGEYVKRYDMEREFRKKYMEQLPKNYFACKGTPNCDHPPLEKTGRSNKIYDHIRKNLRYAFVCIHCPLGNGSNFEQFTKHLKEHFDGHSI